MKLLLDLVKAAILATLLAGVAIGLGYGQWQVLYVIVAAIGLANLVLLWEARRYLVSIYHLFIGDDGATDPMLGGTLQRLREWAREARRR